MSDIIQAINSNDLVKFKRCFAEAMKEKVGKILKEEQLAIAKSIMVEGEYVVESEEDAIEDEDDGSNDADNDDKKKKNHKKDED
ncbi:prohead [Acinetobacter phage ZZ1]|jgi:hypothetical protein|uniref:Prohead core protein n=3 Tax=Caudoviricetes TaxID=2731619 RepID=A0A410T5L3_9CAUD|nr:prohead [Acinetobacter phage ZZ1]AFL47758.1 prohead core protein [Acinetobacter phage ZZ1]QAU04037.1 prohead core protein [Acinetobacter phage Henu6]